MKNTICFLLMVSLFSKGFCQTTTLPDKSYGEGGSKTVTTTTNKHGEKTTVTEIKDSDGNVRDRNHTWKDANGNITVNDTNFTKRGDVFKTVHQEFDNKKTLVNSQSKEWVGGNVIHTINRTKKQDGTYDVHIDDKEKGKTFDSNEPAGATHISPPDDFKHPEQKVGCSSRFGVSVGYSYLSSKVGDEKKGYPFGAIVLGEYNLDENEKWAVQLEGSFHMKKEDDFTYKQSYLLGGLKYDFKDKEKCKSQLGWDGYVRIMLGGGFFSELYETMGFSDKFKDCGLAGGFGGGLNLRVCPSFRAGVGVDYIGTKFDNDIIGGFRSSVGIQWNFNF
jgi:hypothetical protein